MARIQGNPFVSRELLNLTTQMRIIESRSETVVAVSQTLSQFVSCARRLPCHDDNGELGSTAVCPVQPPYSSTDKAILNGGDVRFWYDQSRITSVSSFA